MPLKDSKDVSKIKSRSAGDIFKIVFKNTIKKPKKFVKDSKVKATPKPPKPKLK